MMIVMSFSHQSRVALSISLSLLNDDGDEHNGDGDDDVDCCWSVLKRCLQLATSASSAYSVKFDSLKLVWSIYTPKQNLTTKVIIKLKSRYLLQVSCFFPLYVNEISTCGYSNPMRQFSYCVNYYSGKLPIVWRCNSVPLIFSARNCVQ